MLYTNVQGGTGAGKKKALAPSFPHDWKCLNCGDYNQKFCVNCIKCYAPRPAYQ